MSSLRHWITQPWRERDSASWLPATWCNTPLNFSTTCWYCWVFHSLHPDWLSRTPNTVPKRGGKIRSSLGQFQHPSWSNRQPMATMAISKQRCGSREVQPVEERAQPRGRESRQLILVLKNQVSKPERQRCGGNEAASQDLGAQGSQWIPSPVSFTQIKSV